MKRTLFLLAAMMWLVACGANSPAASPAPVEPAPGSTRAAAPLNTPADTPVISQDGRDVLPTLVDITPGVSEERIDCGELSVSGKPPRAADAVGAQTAAACFMSTMNICQSAVLTVRETDTGMVRQFSITGTRGTCSIRQALQPDANSAPAVVDCERGDLQDGKLEIKGCSHLGDFILGLGN